MKSETLIERTKGEWAYGYVENSMAFGIFTKKMLDEGLEEHPICLISPIDLINEQDKANAAFICKAVNNYDNLLENLKRIIGRIEENELQDNFPSAYNRAKEAIQKAEV